MTGALPQSQQVPRHVAIIMDGNRRWARNRGMAPVEGHAAGIKALYRTLQEAAVLGIEVLTVYAFSTENWHRTRTEVGELLDHMSRALSDYTEAMLREGVRLRTIGDLTPFPMELRSRIEETCRRTTPSTRIQLVLALNYGARDEICRAFRRLLATQPVEVNEELLAQHLDTAGLPDPDLVIRTSGETRLSNFLLWQGSYAELHVADALWPDFGAQHLREAIATYQHRERRCGR